MVKRLRFKISADGKATVAAEGFTGSTCEEFSQPFEEALGQIEKRERSDDYYAASEASQETLEDQG